MAKVYFISVYRQVKDPEKLAAYAKLAGPAIEAGGGRFLARGVAAKAYEAGQLERTVLIEFESVDRRSQHTRVPLIGERSKRWGTGRCETFASSRGFGRAGRMAAWWALR